MGDFTLPADYPTVPAGVYDEMKLVKLAREIAMGIKDVPDILHDHSLLQHQFDEIQQLPLYRRVFAAEAEAWASAHNTQERVKLKAGSMLEEFLAELYARINDPTEPLMAKVKAMEHISKLAGFGDKDIPALGSPGDRVQVVINLGADTKLEYRKELPPKVIDHEAHPATTHFAESIDAASH